MRLLNSRTRILEDFVGAVPPYAILSHTWEHEEVSLSALKDASIDHTTRQGWYKIERSCDQALHDGLDYVWVDTVCIDKSSSAELSEAINSMFKWYRDSSVCYGYLYDLPAIAFESSRWFTRGWTLQEMIAPQHLKFYDRNWNFIGSKSHLVDQLYHITGVDVTILQGGSLRFISVARKMSWAAKRQTARVEDTAYCLLGLFDLSMPMLYGEGPKAFIRLQEEIVKEYDDHSLFAWRSSTASESAGIFAKSPADFAASSNIGSSIGTHSEPVMVTNRGVRLSACLTKIDNNKPDDTMLAVLCCRFLDFDMEHRKRIAIALRKCRENTSPTFIRLRPNELFSGYTRKQERQTVYVLKDNHIEYISGSSLLWIRSMPTTGNGCCPLDLVIAHPREQWDERERLFRANLTENLNVTQFLLVFCYANCGRDPVHFLVYFGFNNRHDERIGWCNIMFHSSPDLTHLDMDRVVPDSDRYGNHMIEEVGVTLKCHMALVAVSGQKIYAADLHAQVSKEP